MAFLLLYASHALAAELAGKVVGVTDGDTITFLSAGNVEEKIRLAGIDAPEKAQPFGQAAKQKLSDLVYGHQVVVDWSKRDRYGRIVGKVLIGDQDACLEQVKSGMAWHYVKYSVEQSPDDRSAYAAAEATARSTRIGLWSETAPVPPWDWRHTKR